MTTVTFKIKDGHTVFNDEEDSVDYVLECLLAIAEDRTELTPDDIKSITITHEKTKQ